MVTLNAPKALKMDQGRDDFVVKTMKKRFRSWDTGSVVFGVGTLELEKGGLHPVDP
jgi:hypothetical protein